MNNIFKRKAVDWVVGSNKRKTYNRVLDSVNNKDKNNKHNKHNDKYTSKYNSKYNSKLNKHIDKHLDNKKRSKECIPKRVREMVWNTHNGEYFTSKCYVSWCNNNVNVFNFQVGHDIPESKGGTLHLNNLKPICGNCNQSMGNKYTIQEWNHLVKNNMDSNMHSKMDIDIEIKSKKEQKELLPNKIKQNIYLAILVFTTIHLLTLF
jgi:hypothetical protein